MFRNKDARTNENKPNFALQCRKGLHDYILKSVNTQHLQRVGNQHIFPCDY